MIGIRQVPVRDADEEAGELSGVADDPAVCTFAVVLGGLVGGDLPVDDLRRSVSRFRRAVAGARASRA
jgi:hypothetical protein